MELLQEAEEGDFEEIMELLGKTNRSEYNLLKLCEELTELQEVLLKTHLKVPERRPTQEQIVEEIGDVILRIMAYSLGQPNFEEFAELVSTRISEKSAKLLKYYKTGKYKGGV